MHGTLPAVIPRGTPYELQQQSSLVTGSSSYIMAVLENSFALKAHPSTFLLQKSPFSVISSAMTQLRVNFIPLASGMQWDIPKLMSSDSSHHCMLLPGGVEHGEEDGLFSLPHL